MKITTSNTITSKLYPDVSYTVRSLSEGRRQQLTTNIQDGTYKMYEYVGQANALLPEVEGTKLDQETIWKRTALIEKIDELTNRDIRPEWVRVYVKEIHGLEIDGH